MVCLEHLSLSQPTAFPIHTFHTRAGDVKYIHDQDQPDSPPLAYVKSQLDSLTLLPVGRAEPHFFSFWDTPLPNNAVSLFVLVQQRSNFISERSR